MKINLIIWGVLLCLLLSGCNKDEVSVPVSGVEMERTIATLYLGDTLTLIAIVLPENATNKTVNWSSSDTVVATVADGLVTALAGGKTTITATAHDGGKTVTCEVTVISQLIMIAEGNINIRIAGSGAAIIDWGAGAKEYYTLRNSETIIFHDYSTAASHTITIAGGNITTLSCRSNKLTSLDVSKNTVLTTLDCGITYGRQGLLTSLNVSGCTALSSLVCYANSLTSLDVSGCTALTNLDCSGNQLTDTALNALFGTLHSNPIADRKTVYMRNNPGTSTCDRSIAVKKGWYVN